MGKRITDIKYNDLKRYLGRHVGLPGSMPDVLRSGLGWEELKDRSIKGRLELDDKEGIFYIDCKGKERDICQIFDWEVIIIYPEIKRIRVVVD